MGLLKMGRKNSGNVCCYGVNHVRGKGNVDEKDVKQHTNIKRGLFCYSVAMSFPADSQLHNLRSNS